MYSRLPRSEKYYLSRRTRPYFQYGIMWIKLLLKFEVIRHIVFVFSSWTYTWEFSLVFLWRMLGREGMNIVERCIFGTLYYLIRYVWRLRGPEGFVSLLFFVVENWMFNLAFSLIPSRFLPNVMEEGLWTWGKYNPSSPKYELSSYCLKCFALEFWEWLVLSIIYVCFFPFPFYWYTHCCGKVAVFYLMCVVLNTVPTVTAVNMEHYALHLTAILLAFHN